MPNSANFTVGDTMLPRDRPLPPDLQDAEQSLTNAYNGLLGVIVDAGHAMTLPILGDRPSNLQPQLAQRLAEAEKALAVYREAISQAQFHLSGKADAALAAWRTLQSLAAHFVEAPGDEPPPFVSAREPDVDRRVAEAYTYRPRH